MINPTASSPAADLRLLAALAAVSAGVTALQVALLQVLGWTHWHHFACLVIAVALLGFGAAGSVLSLCQTRLLPAGRGLLPWLLLAGAVTMPGGVRLAQTDWFAVELPLVFVAPREVVRLVGLWLLLAPPFFCGGLATALVLTAQASRAGRFYSASLGGAGAGGLVGLGLVATIEPPRLAAAAALLLLAAAGCLWPELSRRARWAAGIAAATVGGFLLAPGALRPSQFKPVGRALGLPDARILASRPGLHGWVQVIAAPALRPAPAVSLEFAGEIPRQPAVFVNGLGYGSLPDASALREPRWLDFTTDAAAFHAVAPRRVLLLENGPGGWAALAGSRGAQQVEVVEPNPALLDLLAGSTPAAAPEWTLPGVSLRATDGRTHLRQSREHYEVIRFPTVGALGGAAGHASTTEQFLLTREAFAEAWQRLAPDGVIAITTWMDYPERNPLRLLATLAEMLERQGVPPVRHLAAVRGWATVTWLVRRSPWTEADGDRLRVFCEHRGFDPLLLPGIRPDERAARHAWPNPAFFDLVDALVAGPRESVYDQHPFLLRPASDNRPYFSQFLRWWEVGRLADAFGARSVPFFELGSLVTALTFVLLAALAGSGIVLPLVKLGWRGHGRLGVIGYFGGLGAGFMFAEIAFMLLAHAWLGSPVLAAGVVLTGLLVASGAGSLWSEQFSASRRIQAGALAALVAGLVAMAFAPVTPGGAAGWSVAVRLGGLALAAGILGTAMGVPFPLGLRRLAAAAPGHLPWAWAVNACVSVATPPAALLVAVGAGLDLLFAAAASGYGLALLVVVLGAVFPARP